ncbi:hypothetical protein COL154_014095, partial [Colletotrichum chrysophilum]
MPEQRLEKGKAESGKLSLNLRREGSEIVLTLSDDGQGLNVEKIKQKALALNLIKPDSIPGDEELMQFILTSGFSTADTISQLAGRGVGMDVALLIRNQEQQYAIPLSSVSVGERISVADIKQLLSGSQAQYRHNGEDY